jgi:hypothetical protein
MERIKIFGLSISTSIFISQLRENYISKYVGKSEVSENSL